MALLTAADLPVFQFPNNSSQKCQCSCGTRKHERYTIPKHKRL